MSPSPNVPPSPPRDWDAIARDYAAGALTITEICTLHGVSSSTLYSRAQKLRWKKRKRGAAKVAPDASGKRATKTAAKAAAQRTSRRKHRAKHPPDLTQRLLTALDQKMTEFETRMAEGAPTNAADSERDARTLNTLVRLFDKLKSFGEKTAATKKTAQPTTSDTSAQPSLSGNDAHDADRLRQELAQRLARLGRELNGH